MPTKLTDVQSILSSVTGRQRQRHINRGSEKKRVAWDDERN